MGQGYSNIVRDGDGYFDKGQLDEAEAAFLRMAGEKEPANASDENLMAYATAKLQASMNLGIINMCRGQVAQAEKHLGEAAQLEVRHSDSQRQHHVNTLAVFYLAAMSCINPKPEAEHLLQRIVTSSFVSRALETRLEHSNLEACAHAWLLFLLDRPLPVVLAPLLRIEPHTARITYNTPDSILPTTNFEVDGELEGVELDQEDDDIGDLPSDDDEDLSSEDAPSKSSKSSSNTSNSTGSATATQDAETRSSYFEPKSRRPSPSLELVKAIVLTTDPGLEHIQAQALAQAARALGMEHQRTTYEGAHPLLYCIWRDRGFALQRLELHQASVVPFMIALTCNWTCLEAWVDLSRAFSNAGQDENARYYLSVLTDVVAPNESIGWLERSRICLKSGKFAESAMCCDRITLDIDPKNIEAWERRAFTTLQLRRWNSRVILETLQLTDTALQINSFHVPSLRTKARALIESGRYNEAHAALDVLLSQLPTDGEAIHAKATAYRHQNQWDEAKVWYRKSLSFNPHSADVALHLALCYFQMATSASHRSHIPTLTAVPSNTSSPTSSDTSSSASIASVTPSAGSVENGKSSPAPNVVPAGQGSDSPSLRSSNAALSNSMSCDPSLMPDGTFVGTLPFNQADATEYPNMLTVMAHLHVTPNADDIAEGLEATEAALDIATRYPDHDGPEHFYFEPSSLPRTKGEKYEDDTADLVKIQNRFVKSQIWATRALLLAHSQRFSEAHTAIEHAIEESPECPALPLIAKGDVLTLARKPAEDIFAAYRAALEHDPDSEFALISMIHLLLSKGEAKEALKNTTKLAKLGDEGLLLNPRLAIELHASTLFHLALYDSAYKYCLDHLPSKYAENAPVSPSGSPRVHSTSSRSSRPGSPRLTSPASSSGPEVSLLQSSQDDLPKDVEDDPYHVRLLNIVAQSLHQLSRCDEAQSFFDRSLRPDPMNVYTWNEKARCLLQNKRFDDALNYFERALVLDPTDIRTICNRALCMCLLGNIEEGSEILIKMEKGERHTEAAEWLQSCLLQSVLTTLTRSLPHENCKRDATERLKYRLPLNRMTKDPMKCKMKQ